MKKKKNLRDIDFLVLVWEIQDANVISNIKKTTTRRDGDVNRSFRNGQWNGPFIESEYLKSIGLEPSWNYMVEYGLFQLKTAQNINGQLLKTNYELRRR